MLPDGIEISPGLKLVTTASGAPGGGRYTAGRALGLDASGNLYAYITGDTWGLIGAVAAGSLPDPVTVAHGGTGLVTLTAHAVYLGNGTSSPTALAPGATSGVPLISQGAAADPAYGTAVVAGGGTGQVTLTNHGLLVGAGTAALTQLAVGATGTVLIGSTGADPSFSASPSLTSLTLSSPLTVANGGTGVATLAANGVLYGNAAGVVLVTAQGAANSVLTANAGAPAFSATPTVTSLVTTGALTAGNTLNVSAGNLVFATTGQFIQGDFSNATDASRLLIQSSTVNGSTTVGVVPNGSGTVGQLKLYGLADTANTSFLSLTMNEGGTVATINASKAGTGTARQLSLQIGGTTYLSLPAAGGVQVNSGGIGVGMAPPGSNNAALAAKVSTYNNVTTAGMGVPAIYGLDSRTGLTGTDGAATTLYTTTAANQLFRITADIFATAAVTGTSNYTITWTENSTTQTMVVNASAINTLGTATDLIRPDNATAITGKFTIGVSGTFTVVGLVEQIA